MNKRISVPEEVIVEACKEHTYSYVAKYYKISPSTVYNIAKANGIAKPPGKKAGSSRLNFKAEI